MKKFQFFVVIVTLFVVSNSASALILTGVDTLLISKIPGFDFIEQKPCTSFSDYPGCHNHFYFQWFQDPALHYDIRVSYGYAVKMGKMNLDSLRSAPHDTVFQKSPGRADSIPLDSLASRVGNTYWIKTGVDPRPAYSGVYYAKIKILNFKVIDSSQHKVEMVFLYAFQLNRRTDLATSGLDTFRFSTPTLSSRNSALSPRNSPNVFKVVGNRFTVPEHLMGSKATLGVYDLRGKLLGKIVVGDRSVVDLSGFVRGRGVVVVRIGQ